MQYNFTFEGTDFSREDQFITAGELRQVVKEPSAQIVRELADGREVPIEPGERFDLNDGLRVGRPPRFRRGDDDRIRAELERLRKRCPSLNVGTAGWVEIPGYQLPEEIYDHRVGELAFIIPPPYPATGPYGFFISPPIRLKNGSDPGNSSLGTTPTGKPARFFSWQAEQWQPKADIHEGDNLDSFVRSIGKRLKEVA